MLIKREIFLFRLNKNFNDKKIEVYDPKINQLDNIVEETCENCMHNFYRSKQKRECKRKIVRREDGEGAYFTI